MLMTQNFLFAIFPQLTKPLRVSTFSKYSGLKLNTSKCEICGKGVKNDVPVALVVLKMLFLRMTPFAF